ncbi:hypothetical protein [Rhizobium bangladeshense]|uniref:hypothetical protein n=1 Tax=Rhizobium bangladeshense TaxID=1138189 RepID=UPI0007E57E27|nr:hypothetical protein [Rhizobium bangladeshense]
MLDSQSIHLKALDSTDLHHLQTVLNEICREAGKSQRAPDMQEIAALLISLYRHGVTEEDKLLSVGRLALTQTTPSAAAAGSSESDAAGPSSVE